MPNALDEAYALLQNNQLTIVIRGTDEVQDWTRRNLDLLPSLSRTMGVELHRPFWEGCKTIIPPIESILRTSGLFLPRGQRLSKFTIVGHSKGGAMAHLCGWHFRNHYPVVVSFGAPRCLGRNFSSQLRNHYRVAHHADPVPRIPPRILGWEHFGKSIVIDHDGRVDDRPGAWIEARDSTGPFSLVTQNFGHLIQNHFVYSKLPWC
ncbi:MAG: lipase family protein [Microcoleus sp.]